MLHIAPTKAVLSSYRILLNKTNKNKSHTKLRAYLSENGGYGEEVWRMDQKQKKDKTERATGLGIRTRELI